MLQRFWLGLRRWNRKYFFDYFLVFFLALLLFGWLQASATLPEPDSFYHAKMAVFLSEGKIVQEFPWMQATALKDNFVDHHFFYHLLLAPFVKIFDPLFGVKVATVLFASFLTLTIYWIFKKFHLKYQFIFILILMVSEPWLFRASLVKAPAVFLIFFLLAFYFLVHQKWWALFLVSFFSVWLYAGWPLILVLVLLYILTNWLLEKWRRDESIWHKIKEMFQLVGKKTVAWPGLAYSGAGLLAGLVINPYFPKNFSFYWQQIFKIALVNYQQVIGVGGEWYPYGFLNLITDASLVCALLVVSILLFFLTFKKQSIYSWVFGVLAVLFFFLTLKSRRNVEFFVPFSVIFSAFCFGDYFKKLSQFHLRMLSYMSLQGAVALALLALAAGFALQIPGYLIGAKNDILKGWPLNHYQDSAVWLKENAPPNSVVFNADWDDFPFLFYYNDQNYYLTGLDPTFMYGQNPARYWEYVNVTLGKEQANLLGIVKNSFGSSFVFLDKDHRLLENQLKFNGGFVKVYEDEEVKVYQVR